MRTSSVLSGEGVRVETKHSPADADGMIHKDTIPLFDCQQNEKKAIRTPGAATSWLMNAAHLLSGVNLVPEPDWQEAAF
jgi:hypothetical protein